MRRATILLAALAWAPAAGGAPPLVTVHASVETGPAPLTVTLTASGDAASYRWDLGDGSSAEGAVVQHTYAAGSFRARLTATASNGEQAQADVRIASYALVLRGPAVGAYGQRAAFRGRLVPAVKDARIALFAGERQIALARSGKRGAFRLRPRIWAPGSYQVRWTNVVSNPISVRVRPTVRTAFVGSGRIGTRLSFLAQVRPAGAGSLRIVLRRDGRSFLTRTVSSDLRLRLGTSRSVAYDAQATLVPAPGFGRATVSAQAFVYKPFLSGGSTGPSVRLLESRLSQLHYALGGVDGFYGADTADAVLAFQKVRGLARTAAVTPAVWAALVHAVTPPARYRGEDHIEVDKSRQVLFVVRHGVVSLISHVSTGATGNTPVGRWHVYSKVPGWNGVLWYPMFFTGAFAIHGYPEVPAYPASHGCVRVPMWVAPRLYSINPYGEAVFVYT